jgi:N-acetylmuramoyl-L-alanine amidase
MRVIKNILIVAALAALIILFFPKNSKNQDCVASVVKPFEYKHEVTIILDRAHGSNVAGKGSPDGTHKEWDWSERWIKILGGSLVNTGFKVVCTTEDDKEPGLRERVRRMNRIKEPAFVFSLHNNAAGMGNEWKSAQGFSLWTTPGKTRSDSCATIIFNNFRTFLPGLPYLADYSDGDPDYEARFTVLYSKHPSVLLEYMFQDNKLDLELIKNPYLSHTIIYILNISMLQIENYLTK